MMDDAGLLILWLIGAAITAIAIIASEDDGGPCTWSDVLPILFAFILCVVCWPYILGAFLGRMKYKIDKLMPDDDPEGAK
jgi:hypothetical protein